MKRLAEIAPQDEPVFGGKAAGLGRLIALGARVPEGFVVDATTDPPAAWPPSRREELGRRARPLFVEGPVAVRSSAPGEDSATRSFAGLFTTVLGVADEEALQAAAARCIASGAEERVRAYAPGQAALPVGVVVQRQVAARTAGVCFTVDPGGRDAAVLVEAVAGVGEPLVSGRAQPEAWRVYRSGLGGCVAHAGAGTSSLLTADQAIAIASEASALAAAFGGPLDLEWAIDEAGRLFWLQARPVTAAVSPRTFDVERYFAVVDDGPVTVWANWNVREVMPDPFTPLNWSLWREVVLPVVVENSFGISRSSPFFPHVAGVDLVHGRVYWNMNALVGGPLGGFFMRGVLAHLDARAAEVTRALLAAGVLTPRRMPASPLRLALPLLGKALTAALHIAAALRPRHASRAMDAWAERIAGRPDPSSLADEDLLRELALLGAPASRPVHRGQQILLVAFLIYAAAEKAFRRHPRARRLLTAGIEGNPTTEISLGIDELVEAARPLAEVFREPRSVPDLLARLEESPGGVAWVDGLRRFLARFGHRCPNEFDIASPRWADDPTMIVDLVRAGLVSPGRESATARLARMADERRRAVEDARRDAPLWRRPLLRPAARLVAAFMPLREAPKHYAMFVFQRMRKASVELGRRLAARGALNTAEDVMFLERCEIEAVLRDGAARHDFRARVAERRARHERHRLEKPPDFVRSDGVPVRANPPRAEADGKLYGTGASVGVADGPVRVLRKPDPRAMADGDVLVVEFADPGWTPLFPRAAALVMEVGGMMCHAAVVARELGIPAVFGVSEATRRLADGERVRVDGELGTVERHATSAPRPSRGDVPAPRDDGSQGGEGGGGDSDWRRT